MRVNSARRKKQRIQRREWRNMPDYCKYTNCPYSIILVWFTFDEQDAKPALDTGRSEEFAFCATGHGQWVGVPISVFCLWADSWRICIVRIVIWNAFSVICSTPVVSASGQILLHRFYYFHSFQKFHPFFGMCLFPSVISSGNDVSLHWFQNWRGNASRSCGNSGFLSYLSAPHRPRDYKVNRNGSSTLSKRFLS